MLQKSYKSSQTIASSTKRASRAFVGNCLAMFLCYVGTRISTLYRDCQFWLFYGFCKILKKKNAKFGCARGRGRLHAPGHPNLAFFVFLENRKLPKNRADSESVLIGDPIFPFLGFYLNVFVNKIKPGCARGGAGSTPRGTPRRLAPSPRAPELGVSLF